MKDLRVLSIGEQWVVFFQFLMSNNPVQGSRALRAQLERIKKESKTKLFRNRLKGLTNK